MASHFSISRIGPGSDMLLRNLFEHYVHDMAEWFETDTKADGKLLLRHIVAMGARLRCLAGQGR